MICQKLFNRYDSIWAIYSGRFLPDNLSNFKGIILELNVGNLKFFYPINKCPPVQLDLPKTQVQCEPTTGPNTNRVK